MKRLIIALVVLILITAGASAFLLRKYLAPGLFGDDSDKITKIDNMSGEFWVFQGKSFLGTYNNRDEAIVFAKNYVQTHILQKGKEEWVWDNYPQFSVMADDGEYWFKTMSEALSFAKENQSSTITNRANKAVIWNTGETVSPSHKIEGVPLIAQYPELPRGCEVTSLAMLLNYYGIGVSKMDLAEQVRRDPAPYSKDKNGNVTFGNPAIGFVGDMYDKSNPGLGVYHGPIFELLKEYIGSDALDLTGASFSDLYYFLNKDKPVFVIINSTFKPLAQNQFMSWKVKNEQTGELTPITVTNYEHAVVIVGYDQDNIYFHNPLDSNNMQGVSKELFIPAWEQMGMQAVSYFE